MSKHMKRKFGFVNVATGVCVDVTDTLVMTAYDAGVRPAAAA